MGIHRRLLDQGLLEVRQRTAQIRSAARKGKTAAEIAGTCGAPLAGINAMIYRGWQIGPGVVTCRPPRAELRFSQPDERVLLNQIRTYTTRSREVGS